MTTKNTTKTDGKTDGAEVDVPMAVVPLIPPPARLVAGAGITASGEAVQDPRRMQTRLLVKEARPSQLTAPDGSPVMQEYEIVYELQSLMIPLPCGTATVFVYVAQGVEPGAAVALIRAWVAGHLVKHFLSWSVR